MLQSIDADGGYSSAAERLTVAQDVVGSIPTSRPNEPQMRRDGEGPGRASAGPVFVNQANSVVAHFLRAASLAQERTPANHRGQFSSASGIRPSHNSRNG